MGYNEYWLDRLRAVKEAGTNNFIELFKISDLDRETDFRLSNWSNIDFSFCDLRNFDFTGARLRNCQFDGALIEGACFDQAEINGSNLRQAKDWREYAEGWELNPFPVKDRHLPVFSVFKDAPFAPEMTIVPSGRYLMGSSPEDVAHRNEQPQHEVVISRPFAVGRFAVTFEEWEFFVKRAKYKKKLKDQGWGRERQPVINVSWHDAKAYIEWLNICTCQDYRLLSEAEWEYCCRAGTQTLYCIGNSIRHSQANYDRKRRKTVAVDRFAPNQWGLYNMHGNIWEWMEDDYYSTYESGPYDEEPRVDLDQPGSAHKAARGGAWFNGASSVISASRARFEPGTTRNYVGFRVARTLNL